MVSPEFTEVLTILHIWKDVVVTANENFVTVEAGQSFQGLSVDHNITQVIDLVVGSNTIVPGLNHSFVHLLGISPRTQLCNTVVACEAANTCVTKVRVTD
jgi:hypothetical protein